MSDKKVTPQQGPAPDCGEVGKEKKSTPLTLEEMKEMHIGASHEQPPEGAETSGMAPLPEVEFIENVGKAVSGVMDMAVSAVESAEKFLNDCACEVSSWDWGLFDHLLDVARGYSGEGGEFSGDKLVGAIAKGGMGFVFGTVKGLLNMVGHPVETAKGIGHAVTHPKELLNGLKEQYWGSRKNWAEKVSGVTEAVCDIAFLLYGAKKGFDKLSKGAKVGEAAEEVAKAGEVADEAAKAGEVAEDAAKAGEAGDVAKVGEVAEDSGGNGNVRIWSDDRIILDVVDNSALKHSSVGDFTYNPKTGAISKMKGGGHGQANLDFLEENGIKYNIVKTYSNGVRVGNVPGHKIKAKRTGTNQSWFPQNWSEADIASAGEYVGNLPANKNVPDGVSVYGEYKGVRVGVIRTKGKISTIFPDASSQP